MFAGYGGCGSSWFAIRTAATSHARAKGRGEESDGQDSQEQDHQARPVSQFYRLGHEADEEADLPQGRSRPPQDQASIQELLGIRIEKLKGRILNRERINKTIEGIYFICDKCLKVCHPLDDGLIEDANNQNNQCGKCGKARIAAA